MDIRLKNTLMTAALLASTCALTHGQSIEEAGAGTGSEDARDYKPTGKLGGTRFEHGVVSHEGGAASKKAPIPTGINYHGGPVMLGTTNVYYIWYGNWSGNSATSILPDLAKNIGGSPYFNINTTYYSGTTNVQYVSNSVEFAGQTNDNYSNGKTLSDAAVHAVVKNAIFNGALPLDPNGVYFVLTSKDVAEPSGFCTTYCGWHSAASLNGAIVKYAFVGNADRCPSACSAQSHSSPNGNPGADGMASIIAHELQEAVTDELGNAWYDTAGNENGDKCAWNFGALYALSNGSLANIRLGSRDYLIQENWVNVPGKGCQLSY